MRGRMSILEPLSITVNVCIYYYQNITGNSNGVAIAIMTNAFDANRSKSSIGPYTSTRLQYGSAQQQFGVLYLPANSQPTTQLPTILLIHGGFWRAAYDLTLMDGLAKDLVQRGMAVWNIEYRRVGEAGGGYPGTLQDVAAATDYLATITKTYALDIQRLISIGHSAGGHLAFWLAARPKLPTTNDLLLPQAPHPLHFKGAISLAGVVDLELAWHLNLGNNAVEHFMGGKPATIPKRYALASPASLVPLDVPQVLIHGTNDTRVPLEVSQTYLRKARAAGTNNNAINLVELPATDHMELIDPNSKAWNKTIEALKRLLA
jgi:acetyl esterase/lipase